MTAVVVAAASAPAASAAAAVVRSQRVGGDGWASRCPTRWLIDLLLLPFLDLGARLRELHLLLLLDPLHNRRLSSRWSSHPLSWDNRWRWVEAAVPVG